MSGYNALLKKSSKAAASGTAIAIEIEMPKVAGKGLVPALIGIDIKHPKMGILADKYSKWSLNIKDSGAVGEISDEDVVDADERDSYTNTAVNQGMEDVVQRVRYPAPIPIESDKLFFNYQQDTGSSHTVRVVLHLVARYVSGAQQKQQIINNLQF